MKSLKSIQLKGILSALAWILSLGMFAQNTTVTGNVVDSQGEALIGVTILVEGTTNGTVTDINGDFTLNNVPSNGA